MSLIMQLSLVHNSTEFGNLYNLSTVTFPFSILSVKQLPVNQSN